MKHEPAAIPADEPTPQLIGENIRDLRRRMHLSQGDLARRLGMRQGPVSNLEQGKNFPSAQVLLRLAAILGVTTDRILRPGRYTDAAEPAAEIGTTPALTQPALPVARPAHPHGLAPTSPAARLDASSSDTAAVESAIRDYLALEDICQVPRQARVPLQLAFDTAAHGLARLATQFRALLGIGDAVVFDPLELCENHGLRIVFMPLRTSTGLSFYDAPNGNVFIIIRSGINPEKQLFALAYELGRILLYTRAIYLGEPPFGHEIKTHKAARVFAACFLMPENAVRTSIGQTGVRPDEWDLDLLLRLKHRFGVSAEAFNYRLLELDLIAPERQTELRAAIKAYYDAHAFAEPGQSRRILSPNGRLGDLLHTAKGRADPEAPAIAGRLKKLKVSVEC
jgi:Zn-dependent peptidase ImmA (M78 family)/transcriptional regulator with XRE-family HTH domain